MEPIHKYIHSAKKVCDNFIVKVCGTRKDTSVLNVQVLTFWVIFCNSVVHFTMLETLVILLMCLHYIVVFYAVKNDEVIAEIFVNTAVEIPEPKSKIQFLKCTILLVHFPK